VKVLPMTAVLSAPRASVSDATLRQANCACVKSRNVLLALLPAIRELADILRSIKAELGDDFPEWVTTQLPITIDDAEIVMRFADEHLPAEEPFSQARAVPMDSLLGRLEKFCEVLPPERAIPSDTAPERSLSVAAKNDTDQSLTNAEKKQLLLHSPSLYLQVKRGEVTAADALLQIKPAN
jgi:hypothetical protein